jgi:predicted nucleotidyltransferase
VAEPFVPTRLEEIAGTLHAHGVQFIVIGGQAETLYASPRVTVDVDLCYRRTPENLKRLVEALRGIHPSLRGAPPGLPFLLDARTLDNGSKLHFSTDLGDLDLLGYVEPLGGFEELDARAVTADLGSMKVRIIDLDDLIRIKQHLQRPKDQASLMELLAIKQVRDRQVPPSSS